MPRYETNDIVIVHIHDIIRGEVRTCAIVRGYNERHDCYEVNALLPTGEDCAEEKHLCWWSITENEIECLAGKASQKPMTEPVTVTTFRLGSDR